MQLVVQIKPLFVLSYRPGWIQPLAPGTHSRRSGSICVNKLRGTVGLTSPAGIPAALVINGSRHELTIPPWVTLLDLLREHLQLTGTKKGCDHGQCGACTVLIDGVRLNSCLILAVSRDGAEITTIEGLGVGGDLHPLQAAFVEHDAFQCGYCTPGQICSASGLLTEGHVHSRAEIREV
jgi:xanthine dehydrogenase YagT iron-sulfur-binding subunit